MKRAVAGMMLWLAAAGSLALPTGGAPPASDTQIVPSRSQPDPSPALAEGVRTRLEALDPSKPEGYFLLAEEIAADADSPGLREIARHLYVLAYELDAARPAGVNGAAAPGVRLGPSVCLGLAAVADRPGERRWLVAIAKSMDQRWTDARGPASAPERTADDASFEAATAIGLARAGEGRRAEPLLDKPAVAEVIAKYDNAPSPGGAINSLTSFLRKAIRDWPVCPQCKNRRVVPKGQGSKPGEVVLCDTCRGNPGPNISDDELVRQLRVESSLLHGAHRSWSAQVTADGGAPLRDLDPGELAPTYGVDPTKPLWRAGGWVAADQGVRQAPPKPGAGADKHD
jgi:hypothetical protein